MIDLTNIPLDELIEHLDRNRRELEECRYAELFRMNWFNGYFVPDRMSSAKTMIAAIEAELIGRGLTVTAEGVIAHSHA